ncbi:MAG: hypothetical protein ACE5E8_05260 [Acidimicrobiia bacterium]
MTPGEAHDRVVTQAAIEAVLLAAEAQLDGGTWKPAASGFWRAVAGVKAQPSLADAFAARIATIDRRAFLAGVLVAIPGRVGTAAMSLATLGGTALVAAGGTVDAPWNAVTFATGGAILVVTIHGLAHLAAGRLAGIRFTHWFIAGVTRPQPGVKIDYETYLLASPRARAWMHAAGALASKAVPFLLLPVAIVAGLGRGMALTLFTIGSVQIITDMLWSVKASDWKKFRRELAFRG